MTAGFSYNAMTLFNSRPAVTNDSIVLTGPGTSQNTSLSLGAAISGDLDSFREDDTARGPLIRRTSVAQNSLNGIWVRPNPSGAAEATDAMFYPANPVTLGGVQNYTFDDPLPYTVKIYRYIMYVLTTGDLAQTVK